MDGRTARKLSQSIHQIDFKICPEITVSFCYKPISQSGALCSGSAEVKECGLCPPFPHSVRASVEDMYKPTVGEVGNMPISST